MTVMNTQSIVPKHQTELLTVPAVIADQGDSAARRFLEFFTPNIRNANTRAAYAQAVSQFLRWHGLRGVKPWARASRGQALFPV